jgi:diguanylate cyclase (GGDEF)-like protein
MTARLGGDGIVSLGPQSLSRLMPMHLAVDGAGRIISAGPTFLKLQKGRATQGRPIDEVLALRRPPGPLTIGTLRAQSELALPLVLRDEPAVAFRALVVPTSEGGAFLNLSFGIGVTEAVRRHALTVEDFAATDLTVEMLYLVEAKTAVMDELRSLNRRLQGAKVAAEEQALTDQLTGLRNRRALEMHMKALIRLGTGFGLMHIDLDFFKQVNDTLGHAAGDHVLRSVATVLTQQTRATDMAARVGGDEFVLLFPGLTDEAELMKIARRIIGGVTQPIEYEGRNCRISASIGVTVSSLYDLPDADRMLSDADGALYDSKRGGRGHARLCAPAAGPAVTRAGG